jgi:hypothetical protein
MRSPGLITIMITLTLLQILPGCKGNPGTEPVPLNLLNQSTQMGTRWLATQEFGRRDVITFNHWIYKDLTEDTGPLVTDILDRSRELYNNEFTDDLLLRRLIGNKKDLPWSDSELKAERDRLFRKLKLGTLGTSSGGTQDYLVISLYADDSRVPEAFADIFEHQFTADLKRYGTTHQILGMIFLRGKKAFPEKRIESIIDRLSDEIAADTDNLLERGEFTDLFAECTAMLCMAGSHDLVQKEWIEFIIDNQQPNGQWKQSINESNYFKEDMDQHATILALYTLYSYTRYHYGSRDNIQ